MLPCTRRTPETGDHQSLSITQWSRIRLAQRRILFPFETLASIHRTVCASTSPRRVHWPIGPACGDEHLARAARVYSLQCNLLCQTATPRYYPNAFSKRNFVILVLSMPSEKLVLSGGRGDQIDAGHFFKVYSLIEILDNPWQSVYDQRSSIIVRLTHNVFQDNDYFLYQGGYTLSISCVECPPLTSSMDKLFAA